MKTENPILVERYRGGVLESFHRGVICVVNKHNKIVFSLGDVEQICYPRSALKLFQIIPLLESGAVEHFGFTMEEIAIMCGSHNGEPEHLRVVHSILKKIGLDKSSLHCGPQYPTLNEDKNEMIKHDHKPEDIHNNCSGKHAGFLALCVFLDLDVENYFDANHPIQRIIKTVTAEMHEYPEDKIVTAIDGCSAPIFSLPVYNQAVAYKNLIYAEQFGHVRKKACETIISAVTDYPYMVAGTQRYCTEMMEICGNRIFGKTGADGVYSLGFIRENLGCTIKIDDGLMGPQYAVAQELIEKSGMFSEKDLQPLRHYAYQHVFNWNKWETGITKVNEEVFKDFSIYKAVNA